MRIASMHEAPVFHASRGYRRVAITHPDTAPVSSADRLPSAGERRRQARGRVKARKRELARGAGFLERLTGSSG